MVNEKWQYCLVETISLHLPGMKQNVLWTAFTHKIYKHRQRVSEVFASVQTVTIATPTWLLCKTGSFPFGTAKTLLKGVTHYSHSTGHLNF